MTRVRKIVVEEDGQSLIEMAIAITTMLIFLFGIVEFTRALYADIYVGYIAHAASRYAMVHGTTFTGTSCATVSTPDCLATSADIVAFAKAAAPLGIATGTDLTITPSWPGTGPTGAACNSTNGTSSPGCLVKIQVTYLFHFALPFVSTSTFLLKSTSAVTIAE